VYLLRSETGTIFITNVRFCPPNGAVGWWKLIMKMNHHPSLAGSPPAFFTASRQVTK
jgi:hypothetical protein